MANQMSSLILSRDTYKKPDNQTLNLSETLRTNLQGNVLFYSVEIVWKLLTIGHDIILVTFITLIIIKKINLGVIGYAR